MTVKKEEREEGGRVHAPSSAVDLLGAWLEP